MAKLTRRAFLTQTTAGAATIGVLTTVPGIAAISDAPEAPAPETELSTAELTGPVMVHVRDLATGEVSLLSGTREIIYRDAALVARLVRAAR